MIQVNGFKVVSMNLSGEIELFHYEQDEDYLEANKTSKSLVDLVDYMWAHPTSDEFRWSLEIGSVQYLAGVFPREKKIYLGSKNLGMEITLIRSNAELTQMREHCDKIARIPSENTPGVIEFITHVNKLAWFADDTSLEVLESTEVLTQKLVSKVNEYKQSLFEKFSDYGLDLTAHYMLIRIHLLKFLAILPCLTHDLKGIEVKRILQETLTRLISDSYRAKEEKLKGQKRALPEFHIFLFRVLLFKIKWVPAKLLAFIIRFSVATMAKRFIAGENIELASSALKALMKSGRDATLDQLGELVVSNTEADEYTAKVMEIIMGLGDQIQSGQRNKAGILSAHVSIKVTALTNHFTPQDFNHSYESISPRLIKILKLAKEQQVFLNIDAEHYHYRDMVLEIYAKCLLDTKELHDFSDTGIVIQAYLRDGYEHFMEVLKLAKKRNLVMPIRLVKGAYWDAETIEAVAHNYDAPQFLNKEETDIHFRQIIDQCFKHGEFIQLAIASHNIQDHCFSEALREKSYPNAPVIEHQCLHMTYEALSVAMSKMDWPTRNYIPVGNLLVGMAYLVRRIMENSSQVGVLTMMRSHKKAMNFQGPTQSYINKKEEGLIVFDESIAELTSDFKNIYPLRTYLAPHLARVDKQIKTDKASLTQNILFHKEESSRKHDFYCSSIPDLKIGEVEFETKAQVDEKIDLLYQNRVTQEWGTKSSVRYEALYRLSNELLFDRERLTSLIMFEAGKTIDEAVADVDEAIDFIQFYIREQQYNETNFDIVSKGVVGVIAPWNFPLAIPCGMSVAALVAGNSVLLKPAEQTPLIALEFYRLAIKAGIPREVFQISNGEAEVGIAIVAHKAINGIVFTGSKEVGTQIYKSISVQDALPDMGGEKDVLVKSKFAITEMGGKNAVIVTNNCELDETVSGIVYAAFAHAGQKCSAASRIIIDAEVKDAFIIRFKKAVEDIKIGTAFEHSTVINPLITIEDKQRVRELARKAREEVMHFGGEVIVDRSKEEADGYTVGPSVFELGARTVLAHKTIASSEVFGPVIHIIAYDDLDQAVEIFNSTEYALTGGIYCQSQNDIDYLIPKLEVGNIYINRPNTGARVAIEPFGGFKMSGTGPKAGSVDYLGHFSKSIEQNSNEIKNQGTGIFDNAIGVKGFVAIDSQLPIHHRVVNTLGFINELKQRNAEIFQGHNESAFIRFNELVEAINAGEFDLDKKEFPNRAIPGQLNFNYRDQGIGNGFLLDASEELQLDLVTDFLVHLLLGNGISIIAGNEKIFQSWDKIVNLAFQFGFSNYNLSLSLMNEHELDGYIKDHDFHFVIIGKFNISSQLKESIFKREFKNHMIKVFYSYETQTNSLYERIKSFTHCRALAINTMRHGAPLDTGF